MRGCNCSGKKSPSMKKWMAQGNPQKKSVRSKNEWLVATPLFKLNDTLL